MVGGSKGPGKVDGDSRSDSTSWVSISKHSSRKPARRGKEKAVDAAGRSILSGGTDSADSSSEEIKIHKVKKRLSGPIDRKLSGISTDQATQLSKGISSSESRSSGTEYSETTLASGTDSRDSGEYEMFRSTTPLSRNTQDQIDLQKDLLSEIEKSWKGRERQKQMEKGIKENKKKVENKINEIEKKRPPEIKKELEDAKKELTNKMQEVKKEFLTIISSLKGEIKSVKEELDFYNKLKSEEKKECEKEIRVLKKMHSQKKDALEKASKVISADSSKDIATTVKYFLNSHTTPKPIESKDGEELLGMLDQIEQNLSNNDSITEIVSRFKERINLLSEGIEINNIVNLISYYNVNVKEVRENLKGFLDSPPSEKTVSIEEAATLKEKLEILQKAGENLDKLNKGEAILKKLDAINELDDWNSFEGELIEYFESEKAFEIVRALSELKKRFEEKETLITGLDKKLLKEIKDNLGLNEANAQVLIPLLVPFIQLKELLVGIKTDLHLKTLLNYLSTCKNEEFPQPLEYSKKLVSIIDSFFSGLVFKELLNKDKELKIDQLIHDFIQGFIQTLRIVYKISVKESSISKVDIKVKKEIEKIEKQIEDRNKKGDDSKDLEKNLKVIRDNYTILMHLHRAVHLANRIHDSEKWKVLELFMNKGYIVGVEGEELKDFRWTLRGGLVEESEVSNDQVMAENINTVKVERSSTESGTQIDFKIDFDHGLFEEMDKWDKMHTNKMNGLKKRSSFFSIDSKRSLRK